MSNYNIPQNISSTPTDPQAIPAHWSGSRREFFARWPQATYADYERARNGKRIARNNNAHQDRLQRVMSQA